MSLEFPGEWMFEDPDAMPSIPEALVTRLWKMLVAIADSASDPKDVVEGFKRRFGRSTLSTSLDWAETDLSTAMKERGQHAATFIDNLWTALQEAKDDGLKVPSTDQINKWLADEGVPFQVRGTELLRFTSPDIPSGEGPSAPTGYVLGDEIGRGGFGIVRVATRETTGGTFEFAYKLLDPSPFNKDRGKALERFKREIRAVQKLQHRAIVQYVDAGVNPYGQPYLVMQRILGTNIRDATENDPAFAMSLMMEVLSGLAYAHKNQVLHRDLKPSNIIVRDSDQQPVILDFGTAYFLDDLDTHSLSSAAVGSLGYIPAEVLANPKLRTPLHDIYSCAVILYELIARRRPNPQDYEPLAAHHPELVALDAVLLSALGAAAKRPQTPDDFRAALADANPY